MQVSQAVKARLARRPGAFVVPKPWDAGTARILTQLGFEALTTTNAGRFHPGPEPMARAWSRMMKPSPTPGQSWT